MQERLGLWLITSIAGRGRLGRIHTRLQDSKRWPQLLPIVAGFYAASLWWNFNQEIMQPLAGRSGTFPVPIFIESVIYYSGTLRSRIPCCTCHTVTQIACAWPRPFYSMMHEVNRQQSLCIPYLLHISQETVDLRHIGLLSKPDEFGYFIHKITKLVRMTKKFA